jgi:hypothetical protein
MRSISWNKTSELSGFLGSQNFVEDDVIVIHLPRGLLALFAASEDCLRFFETALPTCFRLRRTIMGSRVLFA